MLPHDEEGEDDSPFPTLEEVEAMAAEPIYGSRRKVAASCLTASRQGNEQNTGTYDIIDSLSANIIEPLYNLKEDGTLIGEPPHEMSCTPESGWCSAWFSLSDRIVYVEEYQMHTEVWQENNVIKQPIR